MSEDSAESPKSSASSPWAKVFWLFVLLLLSGLIVFGAFIWLGKQSIDATKETVVELFKPGETVQTFHEWRELEVAGNEGNILEVATAEATEEFTRKTNVEWFGAIMPLGTTVSEITVPATYRFHIDLNGDWFVESDGSRLMVIAPKLKPSLPVAFDSGKMRKKTKSGWGRWDKHDNLEALERDITLKLNSRASDAKTLSKARDESRLAVAKFLKRWLLTQDVWAAGRFEEIVVIFEDEKGMSLMNTPATMKFEVPKLEPIEEITEPDRG